jgi:hypothetical protein
LPELIFLILVHMIQSVSNIFVPGRGGYVACPRSAAGSQTVYGTKMFETLCINSDAIFVRVITVIIGVILEEYSTLVMYIVTCRI